MVHFHWFSRRIMIGIVLCTLALVGFLFQPEVAEGGFATSPRGNAYITDGTSNT